MNITYTQNGDYLIPNIIIRKTKPLGHYGRLRKAYLEMHRPIRNPHVFREAFDICCGFFGRIRQQSVIRQQRQ